jgi:hypothetical protein
MPERRPCQKGRSGIGFSATSCHPDRSLTSGSGSDPNDRAGLWIATRRYWFQRPASAAQPAKPDSSGRQGPVFTAFRLARDGSRNYLLHELVCQVTPVGAHELGPAPAPSPGKTAQAEDEPCQRGWLTEHSQHGIGD